MTHNLDSFAAEYFKEWRALSADAPRKERIRSDSRVRASHVEQLDELIWEDAEAAWHLILALVDRAPSDEALSFVAASPIEDLIRRRGAEWAHRIAAEAESNTRFREALNYVWGWDGFADQVTAAVLPLLDAEVRAHWTAVKRAGARGRAAWDAEVGRHSRKGRWRPPSPRPKSERFT